MYVCVCAQWVDLRGVPEKWSKFSTELINMLHSKTKAPYAQAYNSGTREAKTGGFEVWGQLQLHSETCLKVNSQINKTAQATQLLEGSPSKQKSSAAHGT